MQETKKVIIIGGVAGGASVAARLRRLSENVEIIMLQRGRYVSFANCGLPYHIGGEIEHRDQLLIQTPKGLHDRFNIDVRTETEALSIDRENKLLTIKNLKTNEVYQESYDDLVLSPGAAPIAPPIPGIDLPGHYALRTIGDMDKIMGWNEKVQPNKVAVIGGGFIGLEMVEQLTHLGMEVSLVEAQDQVLPPVDAEIALRVENELKDKHVSVYLNSKVVAFEAPNAEENAKASVLVFENGTRLEADLVILSMGVRPEVSLIQEAGLEVGAFGGIRVNNHMRTADPSIWAVGDAVETRCPVTGDWALIPLAGPANRQGRTAADNIMGRATRYRGTWGTSVVRVFDLTIACTGLNEKQLQQAGVGYEAVQVHPYSHVTYYPNADMLLVKLLFSPEDGTIYGAQIIGKDSVERRLDVLATAIQGGLSVDDVAHLELSYAPAFGSPKDPVNYAAMVARNVVNGDISITQAKDVDLSDAEAFILDVSSPSEYENQSIPNAINIPLDELRNRLDELPRDKEITIYCFSGQRSYFAYRMLSLNGFRAKNLSGGIRSWSIAHETVNDKHSTSEEKTIEKLLNHFKDRTQEQDKQEALLKKQQALVVEKEAVISKKMTLIHKKELFISQQNKRYQLGLPSEDKTLQENEIHNDLAEVDGSINAINQKSITVQSKIQKISHSLTQFYKVTNRMIKQLSDYSDSESVAQKIITVSEEAIQLKSRDSILNTKAEQIFYKYMNTLNSEKRVAMQEKSLTEKEDLLTALKRQIAITHDLKVANKEVKTAISR